MNFTRTNVLLWTGALTVGMTATSLAADSTASEDRPLHPQQNAVRTNPWHHDQTRSENRTSWHFADARTARSLELTTRDGQRVGRITDLIVEGESGQVRMYLAELNDKTPDRDGDKVAIEADRITILAKAGDTSMAETLMDQKDEPMNAEPLTGDRGQGDQQPEAYAGDAPKDKRTDAPDASAQRASKADQPERCAVTDHTLEELASLAEFDPANHPTLHATTWYRQLGKSLGIVEQQNPALYDLYFLSDIEGRPIVAPGGEKLGQAENVIVELESGTLALIVIEPDIQKIEGERMLPWGVVTELANDEIRVRLGASTLANAVRAPRDGNFADWGKDGELESVYKPFGLDVPSFDNGADRAQTRRPAQPQSDDI